jgi:hypothetical protein
MNLEQVLHSAEATVAEVSDALLAADPLGLERCSVQLRDAAVLLAQAVERQGVLTPEQAPRVRALTALLSQLREQLARVVALADRRAATVLPPTNAATYGKGSGPAPRIYHNKT